MNRPRFHSKVALAGLAMLLVIACQSRATVIYDSGGFESPRFTSGVGLAGQDPIVPPFSYGPWHQDTGTSTATVQTDDNNAGFQSVKVTRAASITGDTRWGIVVPITPTDATNIVTIDVDMNVFINPGTNWGGPDLGPLFGVECYDGSGLTPKLIGSMFLDAYAGDVVYQQATNGTLQATSTFFGRNEYHHYTLAANFRNKTYSIYVDGSLVHTEGFVDTTATSFNDAPITVLAATPDSAATATGTAYFDNYTVSATTSRLNYLVWRGDGVSNVWDTALTTNWWNGDYVAVFSNNVPVLFDDTGSNSPVISVQGTVQPAAITINADQSYTIGGPGSVGGSGILFKRGSGTLTLTGNNFYSGGTSISNGTLLVNNTVGSGTGTGAVFVSSGTVLAGNGSISGAVNIASGGTLSPGAAPLATGTLTIGNNLTLTNSTLNFDVGSSCDEVVVAGDLQLNGVLDINQAAGFGPGAYTLLTYGGALSGAGLSLESSPSGYDCSIDTNTPGQIKLVVSVSPPPPLAPSGLSATPVSDSEVNLSWTDNSDNETAFILERSQDNSVFAQIGSVGANVTTYSDTGLAPLTTYFYRLRASNTGGSSPYSDVASATTLAPTNPPVAYYKFEMNTLDSTTNHNDGVPTGALTYGPGKVGAYAAQFDGTSSFVEIPASISTNFTVTMWVKTTNSGTGQNWYDGPGLLDGKVTGANSVLMPVGDTSIQESAPTTTRGSDTLLAMSGGGQQNVAYIRFDLSSFTSVAPSTTLTLYNVIGSMTWSTTQVEIYGLINTNGNTPQNWDENTLSYSTVGLEVPGDNNVGTQDLNTSRVVFLGNLPTLLSTAQSVPIAFTSTNFDSFIASRLADNGLVTLMIVNRNGSARNLIFQSKETGNGTTYTGPSLTVSGLNAPQNDWGSAVLNSKFAFGIGNPDTTVTSGRSIDDGQWHYVAATRDSATGLVKLYVDGALNTIGIAPTGPRTAPNDLRIGATHSGIPIVFNGEIDDVRLYDRVLVDSQISTLAGRAARLGGIHMENGNVVMSGNGGPPGGTYYVLSSTNISLPLAQWTSEATNQFDDNGNCAFTNAVDADAASKFFLLQLP